MLIVMFSCSFACEAYIRARLSSLISYPLHKEQVRIIALCLAHSLILPNVWGQSCSGVDFSQFADRSFVEMSKARSETEDRCTVAQIQEFELLRSMYSPSELDFTHGNTDSNFLQHSALTLKLEVERESVDIEVRVPPLYPYGDFPVVFVRGKSDLIDNDAINRDLRRWIHSQEYGTPLIAQIASWVLDNYPFYLKISGSHMASNSSKAPTEYARLYILSHHLRSPVKVSCISGEQRPLYLRVIPLDKYEIMRRMTAKHLSGALRICTDAHSPGTNLAVVTRTRLDFFHSSLLYLLHRFLKEGAAQILLCKSLRVVFFFSLDVQQKYDIFMKGVKTSDHLRSDLLNLAKKLNLTGFSTPGKPAVIVVEGESKACEEFWKDVKSWTWKRISLRHSDVFSSPNDMKFTQFREVLSTGGANAMNDVKHILTDANLAGELSFVEVPS
ncbi:hypothetical protein RB195_009930 [Necator americanus]|uniref:RWD domain-containing protein n=1 Tax=Necator americanus TaxID=51031 RepID=A0ABR1CVJ9_NECAM